MNRLPRLATTLVLLIAPVAAVAALPEPEALAGRLSPPIAADDLRTSVGFLADDELAGRLTGTPGAAKAARYIAAALESAGVKPGGTDGYFQPFEFNAGVRVNERGTKLEILSGSGSPVELGENYVPLTYSASGSAKSHVVFAGYGLVEPSSGDKGYNSYAGLDVKGMIVMVLRDLPEDVSAERRQELALYAGDRYKAKLAADRGASAFLLVRGPNSPHAGEILPFHESSRTAPVPIPALSISGKVADRILADTGVTLKQLQDALDDGTVNPHAMVTSKMDVEVNARLDRIRNTCKNVIGVLPPTGGSEEYVLVGAHYDHIGTGEGLGSLAKKGEEGQIHNGADDNASGTATVLEIAAKIAADRRQNSGKDEPQRGVIFALWSGEELGLVGSTHYAENPTVATDKIAACFNFDMVGRLRNNKLILQAVGSSPAWRPLVERRNVPAGFNLTLQDDPYLPTDATAFYTKGVPALSFFTDLHPDYNRPTDDADTLNYQGMERIATLAARLVSDAADANRNIEYVRVEQSSPRRATMGRRAYTGTVPDMASSGIKGAKLSDVRPGGPADKAGLQAGDIIVQFAGKEINNLRDYSDALVGAKIGETVEIVVERDGKKVTTNITPTAKAD